MLKYMLEACGQWRYTRDQDFEQYFEEMTGVNLGNAGKLSSHEDEKMLVFKDIEPKAKVHLLAVAKNHFKSLSEMDDEQSELVKYMLVKIPEIAENNGCENGYRLVINQGGDAGQTVFHLHIHILGGQILDW